ncbi:GspH/FimT family pseudopilin [Pseudomonas sp. MS15a(2019)]|uniref:GspH/FimT family pseudopilin n=1 Tax=Pseudomonas sp. MS15a(2019) TaxID=2579938 RepID=UPI001563E734|nr:prepilin-type N-terminal cleavage/methylation domain-containing protein [Pseudomonas sp. MS15a(2019)]
MKKAAGFTLTELLIVVGLIAILAAIAVPGFSSLIRSNRVVGAAEELQNVLTYARSEAMARGVNVGVTAPNVDAWTGALIVATVSSTVLGEAETLRSFTNTGLAASGVNSTGTAAALTFRPNGTLVSSAAATINVCASNDKTTTGRTLTITQGGQISMKDFPPTSAKASGCS